MRMSCRAFCMQSLLAVQRDVRCQLTPERIRHLFAERRRLRACTLQPRASEKARQSLSNR